MSGLLFSEPFVAVFPGLVRTLGSIEAAVVLQFVAYQEDAAEGVVLTAGAIADGTGLTERTVKRTTMRLREIGVLHAERSGPWCSTLRYQVCRDHAVLAGQQESARVDPSESARVASSQSARVARSQSAKVALPPSVSEGEESPEHTAVAVADDDQPLDGVLIVMPERATTPPQTAQTLVARWVDGFRESNGGQDPPGPLMKRVAGQAKNLAKSCETDADWGAAWRAAYAAGQHGHVDPVPHMAAARSRYPRPRNYDLERVMAQNTAAPLAAPHALALSLMEGRS